MLHADKRALEQHLAVKLLHIHELELNYYVMQSRTLATPSALIAGMAFFGLPYCTKMPYFEEASPLSKALYGIMLVVCMGQSLFLVFATTLLTMLCPGLALRGPPGSMQRAVEGLKREGDIILQQFCGIVYMMLLVVVCLGFTAVVPTLWGSFAISLVCCLFAASIDRLKTSVQHTFALQAQRVSGAFDVETDDRPAATRRDLL